ncbi:MAG: DUF4476 domain-containing protein [Aureispira sp.]
MRTTITLLLFLGLSWTTIAQTSPMSNQAFSEALEQLEDEFSATNRLRLAEELVDRNYLSTHQLTQLLDEFNFEREKEDLAKRAYGHLSDQRNFHQVYSNFDFDATIDRLKGWTNRQSTNRGDYRGNPSLQPGTMGAASFERAYDRIEDASFDNEQLPLAQDLVDDNYLSAAQVRDLVLLLDFKTSQDNLARYAYPRTADQQNYSLVVEALTFMSSRQALENWLKEQPVTTSNNYGYHNNAPTGNTGYHNNGYNNYNNNQNNNSDYNNNASGSAILSDVDFINIQKQLNQISMDRDRLARAKEISDQVNWRADQVRDVMELLMFENLRLDFATYAYTHTADVQNYYLVRDALLSRDKRQQLVTYVQSRGGMLDMDFPNSDNPPNPISPTNTNTNQTPPVTTGGVNVLSDHDFQMSKQAIQQYSSDNDRLQAARSVIEEQYVVSSQVAQLVVLFAFDDVRLEFAKYAYPKTQDKENYEQVVELMQNTSSQEALRQYIRAY